MTPDPCEGAPQWCSGSRANPKSPRHRGRFQTALAPVAVGGTESPASECQNRAALSRVRFDNSAANPDRPHRVADAALPPTRREHCLRKKGIGARTTASIAQRVFFLLYQREGAIGRGGNRSSLRPRQDAGYKKIRAARASRRASVAWKSVIPTPRIRWPRRCHSYSAHSLAEACAS